MVLKSRQMRKISFIFSIIISTILFSCSQLDLNSDKPTAAELDNKFKSSWDKPEYQIANTAMNEAYLNDTEKRVYYYLNLARLNPVLFADTYVEGYKGEIGYTNNKDFDSYKATLLTELRKTDPLNIITPDKDLYDLALCQAIGIGQRGIKSHDRTITGCKSGYHAECISYAMHNSLEIVMQLLIDYGVPTLGHRKICLGQYAKMGVAISPHKEWDSCAVLDFYRNTKSGSIQIPDECNTPSLLYQEN
jgi:hypothetical protein